MPDGRWHSVVGHTADVGVRVTAPDPRSLLEEATVALAELCADVQGTATTEATLVDVHGDDLAALTYAWLNELIGMADARGEALVRADVDRVEPTSAGWVAHGRANFAAYDASIHPRMQVKAATFHRLKVEKEGDGWAMEAYFDV